MRMATTGSISAALCVSGLRTKASSPSLKCAMRRWRFLPSAGGKVADHQCGLRPATEGLAHERAVVLLGEAGALLDQVAVCEDGGKDAVPEVTELEPGHARGSNELVEVVHRAGRASAVCRGSKPDKDPLYQAPEEG